ncbi:MAG: nucleotidyltransferase family protein [Bacteroidetes bacterium]|nr:nucleotidyltransferase family protein [Bacteroidota bacterium]
MKAMILAAGLGTRLKPFTDHHPKALALVNGKTLLQINIEYLKANGIKDIIVNVHHFASQIENYLNEHNHFGINISISDERDEVLETGGGLKKAAWFFNDQQAFLVMNVDILTQMNLQKMMQFHAKEKPLATLAVSDRKSSRCFLFNDQQVLCGWKNKNTGETKMSLSSDMLFEKSFSGIHIIDPHIFSWMHQTGKFSIVDVYLSLAKNHVIKSYDHSGELLMDVGKPESILEAEKYF